MDPRFEVKDPSRAAGAGVTAETPLVTIAWRALRLDHQRLAGERARHADEAAKVAAALVRIAEEVYRLRRIARQSPDQTRQLPAIADRMTEALDGIGMQIIAPEGEPFTPALMDLIENVAQEPDPAAREPRIAELIAPAVVHRGALLQMGKAVIAVPAETSRADE